jgi:Superinfection immunity protein
MSAMAASGSGGDPMPGLILVGIGFFFYFLPTVVAMARGKAEGQGGIFFVNFLLGWTVVGWLLSFVWACTGRTNADKREEKRRHKEMLAMIAASRQPAPAPAGNAVSPAQFAEMMGKSRQGPA